MTPYREYSSRFLPLIQHVSNDRTCIAFFRAWIYQQSSCYSITKCFLISNSFFLSSLDYLKHTALPLEFRFPWSKGHAESYLTLSSMPSAHPLTSPFPLRRSSYRCPCQTDLCFPGFLSSSTVLTWPLPMPLLPFFFFFAGLNFRVSFISSRSLREMYFSWCYWLYISFLFVRNDELNFLHSSDHNQL